MGCRCRRITRPGQVGAGSHFGRRRRQGGGLCRKWRGCRPRRLPATGMPSRKPRDVRFSDISGRPAYLMTLDQAAELAMFDGREYQDQRENLYLAALPVTEERFSFMAQFFAGQEAVRAYAGREAQGGPATTGL